MTLHLVPIFSDPPADSSTASSKKKAVIWTKNIVHYLSRLGSWPTYIRFGEGAWCVCTGCGSVSTFFSDVGQEPYTQKHVTELVVLVCLLHPPLVPHRFRERCPGRSAPPEQRARLHASPLLAPLPAHPRQGLRPLASIASVHNNRSTGSKRFWCGMNGFRSGLVSGF